MITIISYIMHVDRKKAYGRHLPVSVTGGYLHTNVCQKSILWYKRKEDVGRDHTENIQKNTREFWVR